MEAFDWEKSLTEIIIQSGGIVNSSDSKSINFTAGIKQYKLDFENPSVIISNVEDGKIVSRFPRILPIFNAILRSVIKRLK